MLERHEFAPSGRTRARQDVGEARVARIPPVASVDSAAAKGQRKQTRRGVALWRHVDLCDAETRAAARMACSSPLVTRTAFAFIRVSSAA